MKHDKVDISMEVITPAIATKMLNENKSNRKLTDGHAEKLAADMSADQWTACYVPIVFYEDGDLADGQHRLWAISISGKAQNFIVVRGADRHAGLNFDTGRVRNLVDNARISGTDRELSNALVSTARAIEIGERARSGRGMSMSEMVAIVAKHREAAAWAVSHGPHGRLLRNAVTLGAIGRAYYFETDKQRLARFSEVLSKGFADGVGESAAVAMRNYLQSKGPAALVGTEWRVTFLKVQNTIRYFMLNRQLLSIKPVQDDVYPLPEPGKRVKPPSMFEANKKQAKAVAKRQQR